MGSGGGGGKFEVGRLLAELRTVAGIAVRAVRGGGASDGRIGRAGGGGREREGTEESGWTRGGLLEG